MYNPDGFEKNPLNQSFQYSDLQSRNWTESCKEVQNNVVKPNQNPVKQKL